MAVGIVSCQRQLEAGARWTGTCNTSSRETVRQTDGLMSAEGRTSLLISVVPVPVVTVVCLGARIIMSESGGGGDTNDPANC